MVRPVDRHEAGLPDLGSPRLIRSPPVLSPAVLLFLQRASRLLACRRSAGLYASSTSLCSSVPVRSAGLRIGPALRRVDRMRRTTSIAA